MSGENPQVQVWYYVMSGTEHALFATYCSENGITTDPFVELSDHNWYMLKGDGSFETNLMDFDAEDGPGGDKAFGSSYWTMSTVPAVFRP